MVLTSEDSRRMKEMQAQFGGVGMPNLNFNEEKTLVINNNNELVKKVVELNNDEANKDKVDILCKQIFDLALISNQELDAESISEFINRTNKIMMMAL